MRKSVVACIVLLLTGHPDLLAQLAPEESIQTLSAPEGFELKLFASEPMIQNPIAMDVDSHGRVWVTEGVNYRRNVNDPPDNKIKVLEDTDGDGVADKMTVFTSDLNAAMGVCVAGGTIYVPESPNLYVYEDKNNDLKPDGPRKTLLTGWGGKNHDHGLHSLIFGPDHRLYMTMGDTSYDVTGPDGKQIKFQWGAMIRCEADGTKLEDFAVNFRNPFELSVDSFGNVWCSDNDNDGLKSVRICWILEGGNYGWFGGPENIRNPDGSFDPIHHWRADKPGFVPYVLITGFGSPCGITFYEGTAFGDKYRGNLLHCDAGPREVRLYSPKRAPGVGFQSSIENVVTGTDGYFRPDDVVVAPDGSVLISDWYDGGVGGHAYNDPNHGRIYRLAPAGKKLERVEKPGPYENDSDALTALASPNLATQFLARERLLASGEAVIDPLEKLARSEDRILKARALWLLDRIGGQGRELVVRELGSDDPAFRALAVRILRRHGNEYEPRLVQMLADADGEVFKEALLATRTQKSKSLINILATAFERYDGSDRYLLETLFIAAQGHQDELFKKVVEESKEEISPRLVNLVRILKPDSANEFIVTKLASAKLSDESRAALLAALTASASPEAGVTLIGLLNQDGSVSARRLALDSLRQKLNGAWSELKTREDLQTGIRKSMANPELVKEGLALIGECGLGDLAGEVIKLLEGEKGAPHRASAIQVASQLRLLEAGQALGTLSLDPKDEISEQAMRGLLAVGDMKTAGELLTGEKLQASRKKLLVDVLSNTQEGAVSLLRLIETKKLDGELKDQAIALAVEHPDVNVRILYEQFVPPEKRPKTLAQGFKAEDILSLKADAVRGEAVFLRSGAASCIKCHRVKGQGSDIGPDLSQIGRKYERKALLEAIMNPSAGIAPEFVPHVVETKKGRLLTGFLVSQDEEGVSLKSTEGLVSRIPKSEIEETVKMTTSLMPELILKNVTAQDAADLLGYLESLRSSEVWCAKMKSLGPFPHESDDDRDRDFGPEATAGNLKFKERYDGLEGKAVRWVDVTVQGTKDQPMIDLIELSKTLGQKRTSRVIYYFSTNLESDADQTATLKIGSDDGIKVWLNGKLIHNNKATRAITPGEDKVKVQLKKGKNVILMKLNQGDGPGGLSLSVESNGSTTFKSPEE